VITEKIGSFKCYKHYISILIQGTMQYKTSFCMYTLGQFLTAFNVFLGVFFMFRRFGQVKGFTYDEVLLCFSLLLMEFSLAEMWARGFDSFPSMVRRGEFDRILLRPRSAVLQVLGSKFELTRLGRMLQALAMFLYVLWRAQVHWTLAKAAAVLFMLVGGTALFTAMFLIQAALSFFSLESLEFMNVFTDGAREYGKYPLGVYGKKMLWITTFLVPYALVQYYPFLYLVDKRTAPGYIFLPLSAMWFLLPGCLLWRVGVRHYKSSGS